MNARKPGKEQSKPDRISAMIYTEFAVVLVAENIDPSIVNEVLLRNNSIIEDVDVLSQPPLLTPVFSQLSFSNGLSILAEPNRLHFTQRGEFENGETNRCPRIAQNYLEFTPIPSCTAIGINIKAVVPCSSDRSPHLSMTRFFTQDASWSRFKQMDPDLYFKAVYQDGTKTILIDVGQAKNANDPSLTGILHQGNFHRNLNRGDFAQLHEQLSRVLKEWKRDLEEFNELVSSLCEV